MSRQRFKRFSRRAAGNANTTRTWAIVLSVAAFLILCLVISVVVGLLLGGRADRYAEEQKPPAVYEKYSYDDGEKTVRSVEAYHFVMGADADNYAAQDIADFSFALRHADGSFDYATEIGDTLGIDAAKSDITLDQRVDEIHNAGGYACGYFYVSSLSCDDEKVRDVLISYELALIAEAAEYGVDDILLVGIDVTEDNVADVEKFVARAADAANGAALGVALSEDVFLMSKDEVYLAGRIRANCDYVALDLREMVYGSEETETDRDGESVSVLEGTVERMDYYIRSYPARLIFSAENSKLYREAMVLGIVDFQIVGE